MLLPNRTLALIVTLVLLGSSRLRAEEAPKPADTPTWQLSFKFSADQLVRYQDNYHSTIQLQKAETKVRILNNRESQKHYRVLSVDQKGQGLVETVIDHIKIHAQRQCLGPGQTWIGFGIPVVQSLPSRRKPVCTL